MALRLGQAVGRGARRALSISGIVALVLTIGYQIVFVGSLNTLVVDQLPPSVQPGDVTIGFTLPLSTDVAAALGVLALLLGVGVFLVTARLLSRDLSALATLPGGLFTRRIAPAFLSALVVSVVLAVAIPLGFALLFVPGLFLTVSLQFALFAVAVEDSGPIDALRRSWALASGNRWRLLALVVLFGVLGGIGGLVGSLFSFVSPSVGQLASLAVNSVLVVLMYGILADAFVQLRGEPTPSANALA
ncbi:hypothetical protein EI982_02195 [Haloplanus rallus]|uniref:DUF7847 domain-containing protein n=1 Tax=Haloplanus rallus TaxID=1816183 RepID=A0A6B9F0Q7_9EURY|nr:hypothetical protein [Haloplanus rallus]QGX93688.1 hypothetical protein EI982_02195 [Haloplanus rallus]